MSCVWDGILKALYTDYYSCQDKELKYKIMNLNVYTLVQLLKYNNIPSDKVLWKTLDNHCILTERQIEENYNSIKQIDEKSINNGYDCSSCEPVFFLLCTIFKVNIIHNYNGVVIHYVYQDEQNGRKNYEFGSNNNHFWFIQISNHF